MNLIEYFKDDIKKLEELDYFIEDDIDITDVFDWLWNDNEYELFKKYYMYEGTEEANKLLDGMVHVLGEYGKYQGKLLLENEKQYIKVVMKASGRLQMIRKFKHYGIDYKEYL